MELSVGSFNPLKLSKEFISAGFNKKQSETLASKLAELVEDNLVTKPYFDMKVKDINTKFREMEKDVNARFKEFEGKMREMEYRIIIKLGALMSILMGIFTAIIKIL